MNEFVSYLNSFNNVGGNSTGSLAETQVNSPFFDKVKVTRKIGQYIVNSVRSGEFKSFILTGHAGDGKTSILVQVLKDLQLLADEEPLQTFKEYDKLIYYKDMSEIPEDQQVEALKAALEAPRKNKSSVLISNTGPLLRSFLSLAEMKRAVNGQSLSEHERTLLQSKILVQLDTCDDKAIEFEGFDTTLVNIARVDNVVFAEEIFKRILAPELWTPCDTCGCKDRCPIKNNRELVHKQFSRVMLFVRNYYRFLYENDKRLTIRQMIGQISYALTGNLTCRKIEKTYYKEPLFLFNFANLFFGYCGLNDNRDAKQIKGISILQSLRIDRIALDVDYELFVNQNYDSFLPEVSAELIALNKKYRKYYSVKEEGTDEDVNSKTKGTSVRQAIRRYYLMYSLFSQASEEERLLDQVFGRNYSNYLKLISSKQPKFVLRDLQNVIFRALYMKNVGVLPGNEDTLPLTLRREGDVFQNVLLVLGRVNKNDLIIRQEPVSNEFEDTENKQKLYLDLKEESFLITLPILSYFSDLIAGSIASNNNPALTHGIAQLETIMLKQFADSAPVSEDDCELQVIINTTSGQESGKFAFEGHRLSII